MTLKNSRHKHNYWLTVQLQYLFPYPDTLTPWHHPMYYRVLHHYTLRQTRSLSLTISRCSIGKHKGWDLVSLRWYKLPVSYLVVSGLFQACISVFSVTNGRASPPRLSELLKLSIQKTENYDDAGGWRRSRYRNRFISIISVGWPSSITDH